MANCCDYYFHSIPVAGIVRITGVSIAQSGGSIDTTNLTGVNVWPNFIGMVEDIKAQMVADGALGELGDWSFNVSGGLLNVYIRNVNFQGLNTDCTTDDYYSYITFNTGTRYIYCHADNALTKCYPCETPSQIGVVTKCEECLEITYEDCPDIISVQTDLPNSVQFYGWLTDSKGNRFVFPVTLDGGQIASINLTGNVIRTPYSGFWELSYSRYATKNSKEVFIQNNVEYSCIIINFEKQN